YQSSPTIVSDGAHGAIIAWSDDRIASPETHIFAQHMLATSAPDALWPVDGRQVSGASSGDGSAVAISDGQGGAIVTWIGFDATANAFAQHIQSTGVIDARWPTGGKALGVGRSGFPELAVKLLDTATDGAGGAIVAWQSGNDLVAQHVLSNGALDASYPAGGRGVNKLPSVHV